MKSGNSLQKPLKLWDIHTYSILKMLESGKLKNLLRGKELSNGIYDDINMEKSETKNSKNQEKMDILESSNLIEINNEPSKTDIE